MTRGSLRVRVASIVTGIGVSAASATAQNIASNGDFESGVNPGYLLPVGSGNTEIAAWTVVRPVEYVGGLWAPFSGDRSIHLNSGGAAGAIQQTVATAIGSSYRIDFYIAGHPVGEPTTRHLRVAVGPSSGSLSQFTDYVVDVFGCSSFHMCWALRSQTFAASSNQTVVRFESFDTTGNGPAIDVVTISPTSPVCAADFDDGSGTGTPDGGVGIEDLLYYLLLYDLGAAAADVDDGSDTGTRDGGVGIEDLLYLLIRYDLGC
jgi:choice-of-anchor C domain-containing protein